MTITPVHCLSETGGIASLIVSTAEIEYAFTHAPVETLPLLIDLIFRVIESSQLYAEERARQELRTGCITVFIRPRKLDGSTNIVTGLQACHTVQDTLDLINQSLSRDA
jgi:GAF domain-containing protein